MCSDSSSPVCSNEPPASRLRYTPFPYGTDRCPLFSPVPSQITFELDGSTTTVEVEYTG